MNEKIKALLVSSKEKLVVLRGRAISSSRKFPLLGGLVDCKRADHASAAKEVFTGLVFSTITFWLSAILLFFQARSEESGALDTIAASFKTTIGNGELFVFAVSVVGPIAYIALEEPAWAKREFPQKLWHALALLVLALVCGALFAAVKTGANMDMERIVEASVWLAITAVIFRYLATVFNRARSRPAEEMRQQTEDFVGEFEKHREGAANG